MFIPQWDFEADDIKISLHFEGSQVSKIIQAYLDINPSPPADLSVTLKKKKKKKSSLSGREKLTVRRMRVGLHGPLHQEEARAGLADSAS